MTVTASFQNPAVGELFECVKARDPAQPEFLQAVEEVFETLEPVFDKRPELIPVMARLVEPERMIQFRVAWVDDAGKQHVNRGYRIQFSTAIGPYKGGLRFHPTVTLSVIKFLGFEQIFKNSLTTLPMGGGKGGCDFDPKGKSDGEVMRFCQAFMTELQRHIGADTDVPAGDIGVGGREVGFMFGQYKRIRNEFVGILTGKGLSFGGSLIRPEATGYGLVYFVQNMLEDKSDSLQGKRVAVSGSGNVAIYTVEKLLELGATVLTVSDSTGYVYFEDGLTKELLEAVNDHKVIKRGRLSDFKSGKFVAGKRPWEVPTKFDIALPCATQNEVEKADADLLVKAGVKLVAEGANMPSTSEAIALYHKNGIEFGPAKAANAGGVAVSGLEMAQNSARLSWSREEVDDKLKGIMKAIFDASKSAAKEYSTHLQAGANIAGFLKVADAMLAHGVF
ncbi:putative glutamate dehydrogenase [Coccomyxa subellipsoidea C-169]|uniref:Glutamate dehydrogenase n=1 Tax=Coccomyxa subellipsoidea (strain C-169) TaxID=574566 RepID=I0YWZ0_COCSC|nr:putative glutamate dehydrogenase [Coccomyxa subellipsoidea C-169]EIE22909.1 putative glutamate dehydrogenase [Coccomyxa subellipsoidea C-169]|eukprot:XP_005647453.1 putative glutamate dehydrogenase [Coccomyxa subellipsoidea C-169]